MRVIWAPVALDRAAEITRYIAAERPAAAGRWIDGLMRLTGGLSRTPRRGRIVPEVGRPDVREIFHGRYRVIYRLDPKRVVVLTVWPAPTTWTSRAEPSNPGRQSLV